MEEDININKIEDILIQYQAKNQHGCWGIEKYNSWIWVNYYLLEYYCEIRQIWNNISFDLSKKIKSKKMKTALFVQPSKDINAVFLALDFCQDIYNILDKKRLVVLYHADSGLFINSQIENLCFKNSLQFYDYRLIDEELIKDMIEYLECEFQDMIDCIIENEIENKGEYTEFLYRLLKMRSELKIQNIDIWRIKKRLNYIDIMIYKLLKIF